MNNTLLSKDELSLYDYVKLRNIILDIFKLFKYLKRTDDKISIPRITSDYRVRYEQFVPVKTSVVENCVLKNCLLNALGSLEESDFINVKIKMKLLRKFIMGKISFEI